MRTSTGIFLGLAYVALCVALILLLEGLTQVDARYLGAPVAVVIGVLPLGFLGVIRKRRMKRMYRDLKGRHSVVYGCGLHASLRVHCVTSDRDAITIWDYGGKGEYTVRFRMARAETVLRRELVQAAQARKYEGLVIENGRPESPDYMLLYRGHSGSALFPLKGEELETAKMRLLNGVV